VRKETLRLAQWTLLVTNLPAQNWSAQSVWRLYKARWQIELFFKRLKSLLGLCVLRVKRPEAVETVVCVYLLAWWLQEEEQAGWQRLLENLTSASCGWERPLSGWRLTQWCLLALQQAVLGNCDLKRLQTCANRLQRFLRDSPRKRRQQANEIQRWWQLTSPATR
jgi:hypothetical protein